MSCPDFDAIKISIASPDTIREWSYGEVLKPETINYRTLKPERDGLFCERIFGPTKDWECHCGKYKKIRYKGKICDRCGVEVTRAKVRRERMGHIELAAPVSHIWYFKGIPSRMGTILDISPRLLEQVLYFVSYIVTDPGSTPLSKNQILSEREYRDYREKYEYDFDAGMGAEAVQKLLADIDLAELSVSLRKSLEGASGQKKIKLVKRLEVVDAFLQSGNRPEWMIIEALPIIPPELRPMVQLDGGRFATSDLNDLYRRVINRNNRLKHLMKLNAPDIIIRNEKRMLQEAVDALIDNGRRGRAVTGANNRALKSLSDMLKGKQGRFRQNLLGKRVDYSGRSVIVVGPELKIYQCGLPKEMAVELFRPFIMKKLVQDGSANNIKSAKKMVDKGHPAVWDALDSVIKDHPVMLNRAPTLHRLSIQAFEPVLVEGRAIKLHPLVCTPFNADFDGDQMAVHVPLGAEAQAEARVLMLSANNLLRPQDGSPVTVPTQDMVLGSYYLTYEKDAPVVEEMCFETAEEVAEKLNNGELEGDDRVWVRDPDESRYQPWIATTAYLCRDAAQAGTLPREIFPTYRSDVEARMAYDAGVLDLHIPILIYRKDPERGHEGLVRTTVGRLIFNDQVPQDLGFIDRNDPDHWLEPEINQICGKKLLGKIISSCIAKHGFAVSATMLDGIKAQGYHYSTIGSLTVSIYDMTIPQVKYDMVAKSEKMVVKIENQFRRGFLTNDERYRLVVKEWEKTTNDVSNALQKGMDQYNPIFMMADSGARGSQAQIRQLAGMRGLLANTAGKTIEIPVKSNFREGLSVLEYFISSRGARKGLSDTALRTADSGYLTRRLVDVSQEVIVRSEDCGTDDGIMVYEIEENGQVIETFGERINGRFLSEPICDPETGELLFDTNTIIYQKDAELLEKHGIHEAKVRSVLTCHARNGVCSKCYGLNLALQEQVGIGESVGIIAAQSIGEPGTQLTMRTFHTGGVASAEDITQGLPRVEELFEARKPKGNAIISRIDGTVSITSAEDNPNVKIITITSDNPEIAPESEKIPVAKKISVTNGEFIKAGTRLFEGNVNPHDILDVLGVQATQNYIVKEVQKVYRSQGVEINDKHIEIIVHQMLRKIKITEPGGSGWLPGETVDIVAFRAMNQRLDDEGKERAVGENLLLGTTKAALATDSFLSAASFQETTRVLTEAAIKGKEDPLLGLKENVIIGKLIPAGTGMSRYRKLNVIHKGESFETGSDAE